jgi:DNA-binding XRE family transcriptional regulator
MSKKQWFREDELGALAKRFREKAERTKAEAAQDLGVARPSIQLAEENLEQSLTKLRIRMIERYSRYKVVGPAFRLEEKSRPYLD